MRERQLATAAWLALLTVASGVSVSGVGKIQYPTADDATIEWTDAATMAHGDSRAAVVPDPPPLAPLKLWERVIGPGAQISADDLDGDVFVAADNGTVARIRAIDGFVKWRAQVPGNASAPAAGAENLFVSSDTVHALRLQDGSLNFSLPTPLSPPSAPLVRFGSGFYTTGDRVVKFDPDGGAISWTSGSIASGIGFPSAGTCCTVTLQVVAGDTVFVVHSANGSLVASHKMPGRIYQGSVLTLRSFMYLADATGRFDSVQDTSGALEWSSSLGRPVTAQPVMDGGNLVGGTDDGYAYAIDYLTGTVVWTSALGAPVRSAAARGPGLVLFGAEDGMVHAHDSATGSARYEIDVGAPVRGPMRSSRGILLAPSGDRLVAYDLHPTELAITSNSDGQHVPSTQIALTGFARDDYVISRVSLSVDGSSWVVASVNWTSEGDLTRTDWRRTLDLVPGWNTVKVRATALHGSLPVHNETAIRLFADVEPPQVSIQEPLDGSFTNLSKVRIAGTSSDSGGLAVVAISHDNSTWSPANGTDDWSGEISLVAGSYYLYARATDFAGNRATSSVSVTVIDGRLDITPPTLAALEPADGGFVNSLEVMVRGEAEDDTDLREVEARVSGGAWSRCAGTRAWECALSLLDGPNHVEARATDTFSNSALTALTINVDRVAPRVVLLEPGNGSHLRTSGATIRVNASDDDRIARVEANGPAGTTEGVQGAEDLWTIDLVLEEGANAVTVVARDRAGNVGTIELNVTRDTVPPTLVIEYLTRSAGLVRIFGTADDAIGIGRVEARPSGGAWVAASGTQQWFVSIPGDPEVVDLRATDLAGNEHVLLVRVRDGPAPAVVGATVLLLAGVGALVAWKRLPVVFRRRPSPPISRRSRPPRPRAGRGT